MNLAITGGKGIPGEDLFGPFGFPTVGWKINRDNRTGMRVVLHSVDHVRGGEEFAGLRDKERGALQVLNCGLWSISVQADHRGHGMFHGLYGRDEGVCCPQRLDQPGPGGFLRASGEQDRERTYARRAEPAHHNRSCLYLRGQRALVPKKQG